jgi:SRSO17 transposase
MGCASKQSNTIYTKSTSSKSSTSQPNTDILYKTEPLEEMEVDEDDVFKIAVVFPSKVVGKYASNTINTIMGYLLYKNQPFVIESFDSMNQEEQNIANSLEEIKRQGFKKVIALYTKEALSKVIGTNQSNDLQIYFPLIHKKDSVYNYSNFIYGAISYEQQIEKLLSLSNGKNAMFYEQSDLGFRLKGYYESDVPPSFIEKSVSKIDTKYKKLADDESLNETTLMLNTPIIKSSIILSQLRAYDIKPQLVLSTQLNYNPLLVSLTQFEDRVNFITANSIEQTPLVLNETIALLDAEINYNWVNYSSLVGINYFFSKNEDKLIKNSVINNQVLYNVHLYNSTKYGFQKINLK